MTIWDPNLLRIYRMRPDLCDSPPIRRDPAGVIDLNYYLIRGHRHRSDLFWSLGRRLIGVLRSALHRAFAQDKGDNHAD